MDHVCLGGAREEGLPTKHFCQNAPGSEHIDSLVIPLLAKHDFWGAVPPGGDVVSLVLILVEFFREAEVSDLQDSVLVENVLRLEVAVKIAPLVDKG